MLDNSYFEQSIVSYFKSSFWQTGNSGDNDIGGEGNKVTEERIAQAILSINNVKLWILSNETLKRGSKGKFNKLC